MDGHFVGHLCAMEAAHVTPRHNFGNMAPLERDHQRELGTFRKESPGPEEIKFNISTLEPSLAEYPVECIIKNKKCFGTFPS